MARGQKLRSTRAVVFCISAAAAIMTNGGLQFIEIGPLQHRRINLRQSQVRNRVALEAVPGGPSGDNNDLNAGMIRALGSVLTLGLVTSLCPSAEASSPDPASSAMHQVISTNAQLDTLINPPKLFTTYNGNPVRGGAKASENKMLQYAAIPAAAVAVSSMILPGAVAGRREAVDVVGQPAVQPPLAPVSSAQMKVTPPAAVASAPAAAPKASVSSQAPKMEQKASGGGTDFSNIPKGKVGDKDWFMM